MSVQLFVIGLEACCIFRSLGRVNLRDCAMIPLRLGFPLVCIAGSLELILTCIIFDVAEYTLRPTYGRACREYNLQGILVLFVLLTARF